VLRQGWQRQSRTSPTARIFSTRPLGQAEYDALGDVLYLWREGNRPALAQDAGEPGVIVRLAEDTGAIAGVTIIGWSARPEAAQPIRISITDDAPAEVRIVPL
jgi:hypothetical protein